MKLILLLVLTLCHQTIGGKLKIRVDDEVRILIDGNERANAFNIAGWQWRTVWDVDFDDHAKILALQLFNQGGPGYGRGEIDGEDLVALGIVCRDFPNGQNPDVLFPGWYQADYDDSAWKPAATTWSAATAGIIGNAQGFWSDPTNAKNAICRLKLNAVRHVLKCRVDDEVQMLVDCSERANAFKISGLQWTTVFTTNFYDDNEILALRMFNQGGPGEAICTIDDKDISGAPWKCTEFADGGNPDTLFPNWCSKDFDDSSWGSPQTTKGKGATNGMNRYATWWWGGKPSAKNVLCRLNLNDVAGWSELKIRVDDDVRLMVDCEERVNTVVVPGAQWNVVYSAMVDVDAKMLAMHAINYGGPGRWISTLNDRDLSGGNWRCTEIAPNQNPDELYPNWCKASFDDSKWGGIESTNSGGATPGMLSTARWQWGGPQSAKHVLCRLPLNKPSREFKVRVDDDVAVYVDGLERVNAFRINGPQWKDVFTVDIDEEAEVLALRIHDYGGGQFVVSTLDGVELNPANFKCMDIPDGKDPDDYISGWQKKHYVDDNFYTPKVTGKRVNTAGFGELNGWWPEAGKKTAVCRYKLKQKTHKLKIRCDDEVRAMVGGEELVNTFAIDGPQWRDVFEAEFQDEAEMLAIQVKNLGGPGECIVEIDGRDIARDHWRCAGFPDGSNPNSVYPGWFNDEFPDEDWSGVQYTNRMKNTPKMNPDDESFWAGPQSIKSAVCRLRLKPRTSVFRIRVDDEVRVLVDGNEKINSYNVEGSQWLSQFATEFNENAKILAIQMTNGPGAGEALASIDGRDVSGDGWRCKAFPAGQNPDAVMSAWWSSDFDDSDWKPAVTTSGKGASPGFHPESTWFWGGPQSHKNVVCRLRLDVKRQNVKLRVDDEVRAAVDGEVRLDSFLVPGSQYRKVWTFGIEEGAKILTLQMQNGAGPGYAVMTVDGEDMSGNRWRCKQYNSNPDEEFPGWQTPEFGASDWTEPEILSLNHVTPGINTAAKYWWADSQAKKKVACRLPLNLKKHELKVRCDDEVRILIDGEELANAFKEPGLQWEKVYTVPFNEKSEILAMQIFNQGGPGECIATIDGRDIARDHWKCRDYTNGANPDEKVEGWFNSRFNDKNWGSVSLLQSRKAATEGFPAGVQWFWGAAADKKSVLCRLHLRPRSHELRMRVDDEIMMLVDGDLRADSYVIPGPQWKTVWSTRYTENNKMLAVRMKNYGGPGEGLCTIDGHDCSGDGWVCTGFASGQNPDVLFPEWWTEEFDDSEWVPAVNMNGKAPTPGMNSEAKWFWGGPQSQKEVLCRLRLDVSRSTVLKMRVDDELMVKVDCQTRVNAFEIPGWQWKHLWSVGIEDDAKMLAIRMFNQGGPGYGTCTLNDKDCVDAGWVCKGYGRNEDADTLFPNWCSSDFDDSDWTAPTVVECRGETPGLDSSAKCWWCGAQSNTNCVCRRRLRDDDKHTIKLRVDDDVDLFVDGKKLIDEFDQPGWNWQDVNTVKFSKDACVIAFKAWNQGGPGYLTGTIDGKDLSKQNWRCGTYSEGNPDELFPNWQQCHFTDGCGWGKAVVQEGSTSGTEGITAQKFWGGPPSARGVVCRLHLSELDLSLE